MESWRVVMMRTAMAVVGGQGHPTWVPKAMGPRRGFFRGASVGRMATGGPSDRPARAPVWRI